MFNSDFIIICRRQAQAPEQGYGVGAVGRYSGRRPIPCAFLS